MLVPTSGKPPARSKLFGWVQWDWTALWMVLSIGVLAYVTAFVTSVINSLAIPGKIDGPEHLPDDTLDGFIRSVSKDFARRFGLASRQYSGIEQAVLALGAKRIDPIVADAPVLEYFAHIFAEKDMSVVGPIFEPNKYGFAPPLDSALIKPLRVALLGLKER